MAMTKNSVVGKDVYDKRQGRMGRVVKEDGLSLVIEFSSADGEKSTKTVTPNTFKRWYRVVEEDPAPGEEPRPNPVEDETHRDLQPAGDIGAGDKICKLFLDMVKDYANQDLEVVTMKDPRNVVVRYNGRNIFEITVCKRRLVVMAHPKSLSPENVKRVSKQYPNSFGWPLSSKFVFTDEGEQPFMKSVIMDGLYFRQIVEKEEEE